MDRADYILRLSNLPDDGHAPSSRTHADIAKNREFFVARFDLLLGTLREEGLSIEIRGIFPATGCAFFRAREETAKCIAGIVGTFSEASEILRYNRHCHRARLLMVLPRETISLQEEKQLRRKAS